MKLFGQSLSRRDIEAFSGRHEQLFGIELGELSQGRARGMRVARIRNGAGLNFTVLIDRALDIGAAEFNACPLAYFTPGEFSTPAFFSEHDLEWLRNWGGGLMTSCGLRNVGIPNQEAAEHLPLHGRISNLPATNFSVREEWDGDECRLVVEGDVHERRLFGENLHLHRRIETEVGSNSLSVTDEIRNQAFEPEPVFVLYHCNWGFPMTHPESELKAAEHEVVPRDKHAEHGLEEWMKMQDPTPGYQEKVYCHSIPADADGRARIELRSPHAGLTAVMSWSADTLPNLIQWKMMGAGAYVTGLEPSNCGVGGRAAEIESDEGPHCVLEPGESRTFSVDFSIATDEGR